MAKRTFDIIFSLIAIVFLAIPMLGIALSVRLQSAGPILFWSERVGRHGVVFLMPKFRTMDVALRWHLLTSWKAPIPTSHH